MPQFNGDRGFLFIPAPKTFRLANGDVADLYERVPVGTRVIVRQAPEL